MPGKKTDWFAILMFCLCPMWIGCNGSSELPSQKTAASNSSEDTGAAPAAEPSNPEKARSTTPDSSPETGESKSPLDQAATKLASEPVQEPAPPAAPAPSEIHEGLKPLINPDWIRLNPAFEVWFDKENQQVMVGGRISLREGMLEMFVCPRGTKEHESVISAVTDAKTVHAGLLATGAIPGIPGYWTEESGAIPAEGCVCEITVGWLDKENGDAKKEIDARQMVIDLRSNETLTHDWVFAGSRWWQDPEDPDYREYQADSGDMICVSNFPTAMLDLNVESSSSNSSLVFGANPDIVPQLGQPVLIVIKPKLETNPTPEKIAEAVKKRDAHEAKMKAEFEARMKEMEKREAEFEAARKKANKTEDLDDKGTGTPDKNDG